MASSELSDQNDAGDSRAVRIGIVVGEISGDILGAGLMRALRVYFPDAIFEGIGGPRMVAEGFHSLYSQDRLAVMGLVEPLSRLPELLRIRRSLRRHFSDIQPAVFIGIDAPDFNLSLERALRERGVKTVHYVSPSVWAWRQGRIHGIAKSVDLMLTLFPFEANFYRQKSIPVVCVGHALADEIPLKTDRQAALEALGLEEFAQGKKVVALLPGSRAGEVARLGPLFWHTAEYCAARQDNLVFLVPSASEDRHRELEQQLRPYLQGTHPLPLRLLHGESHQVMAAANVVVMASGTTTLEAMLLKRPMVIVYKVAALTYRLLVKLIKVRFIGLPNLLADRPLVPELIQHKATPVAIGEALLNYLNNPAAVRTLKEEFTELHLQLRRGADARAAAAIAALIRGEVLPT